MARGKKSAAEAVKEKKVPEAEPVEIEDTVEAVVEAEPAAGVPVAEVEAAETPKQGETFTKEQVEEMIAAAVAAAQKGNDQGRVSYGPDEMVTVAYLAEVAPNSELVLPGYGSMRPQSYIEVPKKEFGNKFMSTLARKLIDKRHLIVMSGLTQDERERWNCDYRDGEVLDERTFDKMLDYPTPKLAEIFEKLCPEHQRFVACRMITAKERGDNRISVEKARRINELSKVNDKDGMLKPVLEAFGAEITG